MEVIDESELNVLVTLAKRPTNTYPARNDIFQIMYGPPPQLAQVKSQQILVRILYISIDAAMRVWISGAKTYMDPVQVGDIMPANCVAEVLFSRCPDIDQGDLVLGLMSWQKYAIVDRKKVQKLPKNYPNPSHFLGVLGISGLTAYIGLHFIGKIQAGETVVVSAAAGAVGVLAIQLAKLKGCKVVGVAGGNEKCQFVVKQLGADACINYKEGPFLKNIKEVCPEGVDVYFDNVGGEILDNILMVIRDNCRIVMCGAISQYNNQQYNIKNYMRLIIKKGLMQGFIVLDYIKRYPEVLKELTVLVSQEKLKLKEDILVGVDMAPRGLQKLMLGTNNGKVIIKVPKDEKIPEQNPKL